MKELRDRLKTEGVYLVKNAIDSYGIEDIKTRTERWKKQFNDNINMFIKNMSTGVTEESQLLDGQKSYKSRRAGNLVFNNKNEIVGIHNLDEFFNGDILYITRKYLAPYIAELYSCKCKILYSNFLIKRPNDEGVVFFHRDLKACNEWKESYIFGIYLDDTTIDSCVYFIKGSHLNYNTNYNEKDALPVIAERGDICIHDSHVFHGSLGRPFANIRETVYIGFTSCESILI